MIAERLLEGTMTVTEKRWRVGVTIGLAFYGVWCGLTPDRFHFPDALNLPIHETGHTVFSWGGEVLQALGGTLLQLLMPLAFVVYFWRRRDRHAASVALWWAGQNCWNIARYIGDARAQELPLVGGGEHDWAFLLATWRLLPLDQSLAYNARGVGWILVGIATLIGWLALTRQPVGPAADSVVREVRQ